MSEHKLLTIITFTSLGLCVIGGILCIFFIRGLKAEKDPVKGYEEFTEVVSSGEIEEPISEEVIPNETPTEVESTEEYSEVEESESYPYTEVFTDLDISELQVEWVVQIPEDLGLTVEDLPESLRAQVVMNLEDEHAALECYYATLKFSNRTDIDIQPSDLVAQKSFTGYNTRIFYLDGCPMVYTFNDTCVYINNLSRY